jgi:hypothetical protein
MMAMHHRTLVTLADLERALRGETDTRPLAPRLADVLGDMLVITTESIGNLRPDASDFAAALIREFNDDVTVRPRAIGVCDAINRDDGDAVCNALDALGDVATKGSVLALAVDALWDWAEHRYKRRRGGP